MNVEKLSIFIDKENIEELYSYVKEEIEKEGRPAGTLAYSHLCGLLNVLTEESKVEITLDILDALSGYCGKDYRLGTGDYHLP